MWYSGLVLIETDHPYIHTVTVIPIYSFKIKRQSISVTLCNVNYADVGIYQSVVFYIYVQFDFII